MKSIQRLLEEEIIMRLTMSDHLCRDNIREHRVGKRWFGDCTVCGERIYSRPHGNADPIKALKKAARKGIFLESELEGGGK